MVETSGGTRIRVNVATTSKGIPSWEATVERWDDSIAPLDLIDQVLALSDRLHAELGRRYGAQQEAGR